MRAAAAQCHDVVAAEDRARLVAGDQQGDPLGRPEPSVTSVGASVFRIDLDNVVFRITEEQCAVAPVRQVGWCSYDRDTFRNQLGNSGFLEHAQVSVAHSLPAIVDRTGIGF